MQLIRIHEDRAEQIPIGTKGKHTDLGTVRCRSSGILLASER